MSQYEIEIKGLLGKKKNVDDIVSKMESIDPNFKKISQNKQLNHYFSGNNIVDLYENVEEILSNEEAQEMRDIIEKGKNFSVRTRKKNEDTFLIIKASVDEGTSENTVSRLEFEKKINFSIDEIDNLILKSGYSYQAKWSRKRSEYVYKDMNVCIDKNAGYGYLIEFEKIINDKKNIANTKSKIRSSMKELGIEELPQDRLERMFDYYNKNWHQYYGTERTFTVK